jgi:hypothetical protein
MRRREIMGLIVFGQPLDKPFGDTRAASGICAS